MLYSVTEAQGTGGLTECAVPPYISKAHIKVYVDFVPTTAFEWLDAHKVRAVVPTGKTIRVVRSSSPGTRLTDYTDGTVLGGDTLDMDSLQAFYLAQEALDIAFLSGSAVGTPAPGTENTTAGLLALLTGSITTSQFSPELADTVGLINAPATTNGSVNWRLAQEAEARAAALVAEAEERAAGLLAEAFARAAAITTEAATRQAADESLASQVTTLTAAADGAASAVQTEVLARISADNALASQITTVASSVDTLSASVTSQVEALVDADEALATRVDTLEASVGEGFEAAIAEEATARASADSALASQITTVQASLEDDIASVTTSANATAVALDGVKANYTLKVSARSDGKYAVAGIGLNATAPTDGPTQSEMILMADKVFIIPDSSGLNATLAPLFSTGLVNGTPTTIFSSTLWGDKTMPARVIVDGVLEARHFSAEVVKAEYIDTKELTIKDASGNVIFSASHDLDWTRIANIEVTNAHIAGDISSDDYVPDVSGWILKKADGSVECQNIKARGDIRATSLIADVVETENLKANAVSKVVAAGSVLGGSTALGNGAQVLILSLTTNVESSGTVLVNATAAVAVSGVSTPFTHTWVKVRIVRDGAVEVSSLQVAVPVMAVDDSMTQTLYFSGAVTLPPIADSPGSGTHGYQLYIQHVASASTYSPTFSWGSRGLTAMEMKR